MFIESEKWNDKSRTGLEGMLMKHTLKYAKNGLSCYGRDYAPTPNIIDDINNIIKNHDLVDLYTSLGEIKLILIRDFYAFE